MTYPDATPSTDIAVQPTTDGSARALVTLKSSAAATEQRFQLDLPAGTEAIGDGQGGYAFVRQGGEGEPAALVGAMEAPWAKDANGKHIPTSYKLEGNTLIQSIKTNSATAFPVVADPKVSLGWYIYLRFSKKEVKELAGTKLAYFSVVAAAMACTKIPNAVAAAGCATATALQASSLLSQAKDAARAKQCVEWKVTYVGIIKGWKRYKC
ncbi:hypothetical protein [Streptomyces sp. BA2]|uniref:hypothetical protein n=1 Tax=Streptomyces sp. BA2 TaxID=436595 RepID=UPI0013288E8F|nr:hypothetical protein [Streptomyces sp. BA2]MWA07906.1 hypothetical protein [Streptomyces sp. BA2]